jgi:hypothetical protein
MGLIWLTIRATWVLLVGLWLGPLMFGVGYVLSTSDKNEQLGKQLMESASSWTTLS